MRRLASHNGTAVASMTIDTSGADPDQHDADGDYADQPGHHPDGGLHDLPGMLLNLRLGPQQPVVESWRLEGFELDGDRDVEHPPMGGAGDLLVDDQRELLTDDREEG